jgi:phosphomannomutase
MGQLMMSVSGVRGVVGSGLSPDLVCRLGGAFGNLLGGGKVVVGRDSRLSGEMVYSAVLSGLLASGCDVIRLGILPTPTVQLMVEALGAQGGIAVTASHNPPHWNALKFISHRGTFLQKDEAEELFAIERENRIGWVSYDAMGNESEFRGGVDAHIERILSLPLIDPEPIASRSFRVVVDALHGAAGPITARLMQALGCEAEILYEEPTGRFSREAEPLPQNIPELCERVRETKADVGFALDPDGDRLAIVDENGLPIGEDATLPLAMSWVLRERKGPVVASYSTSLLVDEVASRHDCPVFRAPVGEANVVSRMREVEAVIGGEGNGGVILPDVHLGRDALVAMALVLALLAHAGRSVSSIMAELPTYLMRKDKLDLSAERAAVSLDEVANLFEGAQIDRTDGIYLKWADGFLHVRRSGTEPIIRVIGEALEAEVLNQRIDRVRELIEAGQ